MTAYEGLTFRPKVSGSITQSQLKAKLEAKKAAETDPEKAALIDVDRAITLSDLSISDLCRRSGTSVSSRRLRLSASPRIATVSLKARIPRRIIPMIIPRAVIARAVNLRFQGREIKKPNRTPNRTPSRPPRGEGY